VMITKEQLFVQGELVADVDDIHNAQATLIPSLQAVLERPMSTDRVESAEVDVSSREITVMGDKELPYDVVKKVMATCTAANYGKISLAVMRKEEPVHVAKSA